MFVPGLFVNFGLVFGSVKGKEWLLLGRGKARETAAAQRRVRSGQGRDRPGALGSIVGGREQQQRWRRH